MSLNRYRDRITEFVKEFGKAQWYVMGEFERENYCDI